MQRDVELVEGEAQLDSFRQQPHNFSLQRAPGGLKRGQTLKGFRPRWRVEDGVGSGRDLLAPQPPRLLKRQGHLGRRIRCHEIALTELPRETTDCMHRTALLLGLRQLRSDRGR